MNARERRDKYEESLRRQQEEDFKRRNESGKFKSIWKDEVSKDVFWKCGEGPHKIDILPYFVGKNNPHVKEDGLAASLDIYRHAKIGPNENSYICLNKTFGKDCPICELQAEMRAMGTFDDVELKALNTSRRLIYNIHVLDNENEKKKGVQIWEVSQYLFGQELDDLADDAGKKVYYASHKIGKSVSFKRKGVGATNTKFSAFSFIDREKQPSDTLLDAVHTLDELIYIPTYKEIVAALPKNEITERLFGSKSSQKEEPSESEKDSVSNEDDVPAFEEGVCEFDHTFGADNGFFDECEKCGQYDDCASEFEHLEEEKKKAEEEAAEIERRRKASEERKSSRSRREPSPEAPPSDESRRRRRA